ncbi:MAG: NUDIX hydrolase [Rhizobacter sp.]|nr:NUDIX hydrolase [Ferruginibacter sp.]
MKRINNHLPSLEHPNYHAGERALLNSVDCVILGFQGIELHVLLIRFPYEPFKGHWSLIGGFVTPDVDIDEAARITVKKMTGLSDVFMQQVYTFGDINRVPSERVITSCYFALIRIEPTLVTLTSTYEATWFPISQIPPLVYDHARMLDAALFNLRRKIRFQPVGFELLPEKFTMSELRNLYQSILGRELEKRNFTRKVLKMNILQKLREKDKLSSKKGSYLFRLNKKRYQFLLDKGFLFDM